MRPASGSMMPDERSCVTTVAASATQVQTYMLASHTLCCSSKERLQKYTLEIDSKIKAAAACAIPGLLRDCRA